MQISNLELANFRNHKNLTINLDNPIIYIFGSNGIGKTNILEAIYLLSSTKSLRSQYDKDMILFDEKFLKLKAKIIKDDDEKELELIIQSKTDFNNLSTKTCRINQLPKSISFFAGTLKSVIFSPSDLELITGSPATRRKYLDSVLYQTSSSYKKDILEYTKALKQRNKLLETISETKRGYDQLPFWNDKMISTGSRIQQERNRFIDFLNLEFNSNLKNKLHRNYQISFRYHVSEISEERFSHYEKAELASMHTLIGPHKDDFEIFLGHEKISEFGSRGQQRMGIIIQKKLEAEFIFKESGTRPILLLDDIFSELDASNNNSILEMIPNQQTIITSVEVLPQIKKFDPKLINLENLDYKNF
jgi:DNA replication and repair protein RecF